MPASENLHKLGSLDALTSSPLCPDEQTLSAVPSTSENLHNSGHPQTHIICAMLGCSFTST
jgi:hypothetical protein